MGVKYSVEKASVSEIFQKKVYSVLQSMIVIRLKEELKIRQIATTGLKTKSDYVSKLSEHFFQLGHLDGLDS